MSGRLLYRVQAGSSARGQFPRRVVHYTTADDLGVLSRRALCGASPASGLNRATTWLGEPLPVSCDRCIGNRTLSDQVDGECSNCCGSGSVSGHGGNVVECSVCEGSGTPVGQP